MANNQLSAEVQERIKADAEIYFRDIYKTLKADIQPFHVVKGYIAGATVEHDRAQVLVDALEAITGVTMPVPNKAYMIEIANKALQQWKERKEVGDGLP